MTRRAVFVLAVISVADGPRTASDVVSRGDHDQYEVGDRTHIRKNHRTPPQREHRQNGARGRMRYNILSRSLLAVNIAVSTKQSSDGRQDCPMERIGCQ